MRRAAAILLVALLAGGAWAQDSVEVEKRRELEALQAQAREKREAAGKLKGQETRALGELRRTERELTSTRKRLRGLLQRRSRLDEQLEVTRANLDRSISTLESQRVRLRRRLRALYKVGPARDLEYLFSTRSFAELMTRWDFLNMVAQQDRMLLENVRSEKEQVEAAEGRLESRLTEVAQTAKLTTKESAKLTSLRRQRANTVQSIQTQREAYEAAAADLERAARRIQSLLARLERQRKEETDRARSQGRNPQPYSGDFAKGQGQLEWPARGNVVSRFGPEKHPRFGTTIRNDGVDISMDIGTQVHSVAKGRVDFANEDYEGMGGLIVLNHGDGFYTLYGHLSDISVKNGQEVLPGQTIGHSGEVGSLKGPVLHFEVRKGSSALDPEEWLQ